MRIATENVPTAPAHLSERAAQFWADVNNRFLLEPHDLQRLRSACECIDLIDAAEAAIRQDGRFVADRHGTPKAHPGINVARDARQLLLRCLRELCIDVELPSESRVPRQSRRYA